MMKRTPAPQKKDRRIFSSTADKTPKINIRPRPMRGGIRM